MTAKPSKVLVIGSGPIVIGQAAEFDYAGTQACKALREEGVTTVLVNSNPATIMTDEDIADVVYVEPLTVDVLTRIIEAEAPDGVLPTLGGQTGLNLAVDLADAGVLERYGVRLLGTPLQTIRNAEDRELFRNLLQGIGEPVPISATVDSMEEAWAALDDVGLPMVVRPAYTLGGTGGGFVESREEFEAVVASGLDASPISQVLLERSLVGWKEIEYEVMRDGADNCITICNMENIDPMGVHTGDSIVVAPSQTLSDKEYQMLRSASLKIIRVLGIEGGCNIQFALAPGDVVAATLPDGGLTGPQYYVIEVNPRVSRSSALASKATGYPIARVAAKIAVGKRLDEIPNAVTRRTLAAFEPALDYCVVKIPRWPFDKFPRGDRAIGTQMKATGEVMAIDRSFEAAFQKAVRSLEITNRSILWEDDQWPSQGPEAADWRRRLPLHPNDERLWALLAALRRGAAAEDVSRHTGVDPWFLRAFARLADMESRLLSGALDAELMKRAKRLGFSDDRIGVLTDRTPEEVRSLRKGWGLKPVYKMVDTCAAEFEAHTPYFYSTYEQENEAEPISEAKAVVLGSGPIRIGQGIEFDYCSVHAAWALQEEGVRSVLVNSNPETVSTDFDTSDRLYFEPLDEESVRDIIENEMVVDGQDAALPPSIVQFGGQTAINLSQALDGADLPILGSSAESIDTASDRHLFEELMSRVGIPNPPGAAVSDSEQALRVAQEIGYPVLVRPSYVLGGRAMEIVQNPQEMLRYMDEALEAGGRPPRPHRQVPGGPRGGGRRRLRRRERPHPRHHGPRRARRRPQRRLHGHLPRADPHRVRGGHHRRVHDAHRPGPGRPGADEHPVRRGRRPPYRSPAQSNGDAGADPEPTRVYVLEVNPRASRTIPFISKVTGVPMVRLAIKAMLGVGLREQGYEGGLWKRQRLVGVKAPVFSMSKLAGVDTFLGPEMKSTGEVMGIDRDFPSAVSKALVASGLNLPPGGSILVSIADRNKAEAEAMIQNLAEAGYRFYATEGTAKMVRAMGLPVVAVPKRLNEGHPNVVDVIADGTVDAVVNTVTGDRQVLQDGFHIRRAAVDRRIPCFTSLDTARAAAESLTSRTAYQVKPLGEYRTGGGS